MFQRKITVALMFVLGGFVFSAPAQRLGAKEKKQIKPRTTHADVAKQQMPKRTENLQKQVRRDEVVKTSRAVHKKERAGKGLIGRSAIVSSPYNWTLLPKGAVLHVPPLYKNRVNQERHGKLVGWSEFYAKNRRWIRLLPVTIEQARGDQPLTEEFLASLRSSGLLVVAACKGGPISVILPAVEEGEAEPGTGSTAKVSKAPEGKAPKPVVR